MASKVSKSSLLTVVKRNYSAQAAPKAAASNSTGLQVSRLPSGAVVASFSNNSPIARVAVFLRGGSRYDTVPGISYVQRLCATAGLSSAQRTGFHLIRVQEQMGAVVTANSDREMAVYSIASNRDCVGETLGLLANISSNANIRHFELPSVDQATRLKASLGALSSEERALDLVGKAAFRAQALGNNVLPPQYNVDANMQAANACYPIGNNIYVPSYNQGRYSAEELNKFVRATHGSRGLVVVGTGVEHEVLAAGAAALGVADGGVVAPGSGTKYYGGDIRVETGSSSASVAVFGEGVKLGGVDSLTTRVAAEVFGGGSSVKHGINSSSVLVRSIKGTGATVRGASISYTDAGLLGFVVTSSSADVNKVVSTMVSAAKNLTATDKDVAGAKARVKAELFESASGCSNVLAIGSQLLLTGNYVTTADVLTALDAVSPAAVNKAIAKAFSGKLTVASIGGVNDVPYSDTL